MSGVVDPRRIKRSEYESLYNNYCGDFLSKIPCVMTTCFTGSYCTDIAKKSFGDMDLLVLSSLPMKETKQLLIDECLKNESIQSFDYKGITKKYYNSGEMITLKYSDCQIDNIICGSMDELIFKNHFLNLKCECQGLILGMIKVYVSEFFGDDELEYDLSSKSLKIKKNGTVIKDIQDWTQVDNLLKQYNVKSSDSFVVLLDACKKLSERSRRRIVGLFNKMVSVKSGEMLALERGDEGADKAKNKLLHIEEVSKLCQ